jgi:hypothetical protein
MGKILKQMSGNGKEKVKNDGFYEAAGGFRGRKIQRRERGKILENRYSFFVLGAYFRGAELKEENYLSWRMRSNWQPHTCAPHNAIFGAS